MIDLLSTGPNIAAGPAVPGARPVTRGATIAYEYHVVPRSLDADIPAGVFITIVGSNACGKPTLLHTLARLHRPAREAVFLDDADIVYLDTEEATRRVGLLSQSATVPDGTLVRDLMVRGYFPHQGPLHQWSQQDRQAAEEAAEMVEVIELAAHPADEFSGGQRQRVRIALALTQGTETILLDEPTTFLGLTHQVGTPQLYRRLNADGHTVVAILYDLNRAACCAEHMIVMHEGRVCAIGSPCEVLTKDLIEKVFGLAAIIAPNPVAGTPTMVSRHLNVVVSADPDPAGTHSVPADSTGGPTPQSSVDPASVRTSPIARSQQDGQERNTNRWTHPRGTPAA